MGEGPFLWAYAHLRGGRRAQNDPKAPPKTKLKISHPRRYQAGSVTFRATHF